MEENRDTVNMLFFPFNSVALVPNQSAGTMVLHLSITDFEVVEVGSF